MHTSYARDPAFPGGAGGAASTIANVLSRATGAADRSQEDNLMQKAISQGSARLAARAASEMNLAALRKDAFIAAHMRVRKMLNTGGCPRNYAGCPVGYRAGANGLCEPSAAYEGFCGARSFAGSAVQSKEDFAWRCGVSWPCA